MTWPTVAVTTTNTDAGTDSPATARSDLLDALQKLNQIIAHVSSFAATFLDDTSASAARATLGAAASGSNADITALTALTSIVNGTVSNLPSVAGMAKNLAASANGTTANVSVTADEVVLANSSNQYVTLRSLSLTIAGTSVGANALDAGTIAASTWYSVWVIWNGTTTAGLLSTSATAPTLPSGYTHKARVGWIKTDGTANKYPLKFQQYGRQVQYAAATGTNVTGAISIGSGAAGTPGTTLSAITVRGVTIPSTAGKISTLVRHQGGSSGVIQVSPNATPGLYTGASAVLSLASGNDCYLPYTFTLESDSLYWANSSVTGALSVLGWEDNI